MKTFLSWLRSLFGHHAQPTSKAPAPVPVTHPAPEPVRTPPAPVPAPVAPAPPVVIPNPAPVVVTPAPTPVPNPEPLPVVPVVPVPPSPVPPSPVVPPVAPAPIPTAPAAPAPVSSVGPLSPPQQPQPGPVQPTPTFTDDFSLGHLDTSKWIPSNWNAPGGIPGIHQGHFVSSAIDCAYGCLRIKVSQTKNPDGSVTSQGGELQSRQRFGFGTYEWILRASSTSETPEGSGKAVSGQISSGFLFQQDKGYTEIDSPEIEGDKPDQLSWTTWTDDKTKEYTATGPSLAMAPDREFHSYKAVWSADKIDFYVDGDFVARHSHIVPHVPAYAMINHWGTNSQGWGGLATPGVDRYMFVKKFSFTPA